MSSRKITVSDLGYIAPLCQHGPIATPMWIDEATAYKMVQRGYHVTEYATNGKTVALTITNFHKSDRFSVTASDLKKVNTAAITGKPVVGKATAVDTIAKDTVVPVENVINSAENVKAKAASLAPTSETEVQPFVRSQLSKAERRALARQQKAEEAAAAAEVKTEEAKTEEAPKTEEAKVEETKAEESK